MSAKLMKFHGLLQAGLLVSVATTFYRKLYKLFIESFIINISGKPIFEIFGELWTKNFVYTGVEIAADCLRKLIRFIKEPAGLKLKEEKKADSILH